MLLFIYFDRYTQSDRLFLWSLKNRMWAHVWVCVCWIAFSLYLSFISFCCCWRMKLCKIDKNTEHILGECGIGSVNERERECHIVKNKIKHSIHTSVGLSKVAMFISRLSFFVWAACYDSIFLSEAKHVVVLLYVNRSFRYCSCWFCWKIINFFVSFPSLL